MASSTAAAITESMAFCTSTSSTITLRLRHILRIWIADELAGSVVSAPCTLDNPPKTIIKSGEQSGNPGALLPYYDNFIFDGSGKFVVPPPRVRLSDGLAFAVVSAVVMCFLSISISTATSKPIKSRETCPLSHGLLTSHTAQFGGGYYALRGESCDGAYII